MEVAVSDLDYLIISRGRYSDLLRQFANLIVIGTLIKAVDHVSKTLQQRDVRK